MAKREIAVLSNNFVCHNVFKKLYAAEVSESVYMRERVNIKVTKILFKVVILKTISL